MISHISNNQTVNKGSKIILTIADAQNHWIGKTISKKWDKPEKSYHLWHDKFPNLFQLGQVQITPVEESTFVVTMLTLEKDQNHHLKLRYDALKECIKHIINSLNYNSDYSIHLFAKDLQLVKDYISELEKILDFAFSKKQIPIYIYD